MSAIPANLTFSTPWGRALPALLLLWAAILLVYRDTALAMVQIWSRSDTFAHAFLVPPIALWLAWRKRDEIGSMRPRPQPWFLVPLAAVGFLWLLGELVVVNAATQFALVAMVVLAVPAVLGATVARSLLFPLGFLFFAVPIGEFMTPYMISWTADATVIALRWTGVPVYREGMKFIIPSGHWSVVEACSGVRYLIASFMVGTLFAYLNYRSTRRRWIFVGVSILVPIVANWMRAYMIVMLGHLSGNTIAVGVDHLIYGWLFFGVVIMIMFMIGARWSEPDTHSGSALQVSGKSNPVNDRAWVGVMFASVLVATLPQLIYGTLQRSDQEFAAPGLLLPDRLGRWEVADSDGVQWQPKFANPSTALARTYVQTGRTVGVFVAYYRGQHNERKLVSSQNVLVSTQDRDWNQASTGKMVLPLAQGQIDFRTAVLLGHEVPGNTHRPVLQVWKTYWVDGRFVADDPIAKLLGAFAQLRGRGDDGAVIVLFADAGSPEASQATLTDFARENFAAIDGVLRQARDGY